MGAWGAPGASPWCFGCFLRKGSFVLENVAVAAVRLVLAEIMLLWLQSGWGGTLPELQPQQHYFRFYTCLNGFSLFLKPPEAEATWVGEGNEPLSGGY